MVQLTWNPPKIDKQIAKFNWQADYAAEVHEGAFYLNGVRGIGRPWTDVTISETDIPRLFADNFKGDIGETFEATAHDLADKFSDVIDNYDWGVEGSNEKTFRTGVPTWKYISDSGELRDSLLLEVF